MEYCTDARGIAVLLQFYVMAAVYCEIAAILGGCALGEIAFRIARRIRGY